MQKFSGLIIFISFITTLYSYFLDNSFLVFSSLMLWSSVILLFTMLKNIKVVVSLISLSLVLFGLSYLNGFKIDFNKVFSINQYLVILLIGVGFLRLIIDPKDENTKNSIGKDGFLKTYFSLHLFGSVINISALILVADEMYKKTKHLTNIQLALLTRAFSSDAYWSPFFVAFGAAITFTPKLDVFYIISSGLTLALFSFVVTYFEVRKSDALNSFEGYPLNFLNLALPFSLAISVLVVHSFYEEIKIIVLIALLAFILSLVVLPIKNGVINTIEKYKIHISNDLPNMRNEISLFLAAGMFGVSVSSVLNGIGFTLPFGHFDYIIASGVLLLFIVLSFIGIHPIISISIFGHMLAEFNQTLVAISFLMAWGITVSSSPFSGVNLTLHSRYGIDVKNMLKTNFSYVLKMYLFCIVLLYIVSNTLGIN